MPGSLPHLVRRFFDFLTASPLSPHEIDEVRGWLDGPQQRLFFDQDPRDQSHGYHAATVVLSAGITDLEPIQAALLHDVGKRAAHLGPIGRSLASVLIKAKLPLTRRMRLYRDHGASGADELLALGAAPLVVDFARHHHGLRPDSITSTLWEVLQKADQPAKPQVRRRQG